MDHAKLLLVVMLLLSSSALNAAERRLGPAPPCYFPAIYNFGDSNSDTGGLSAAFGPVPPPYGSSFFRTPSGRYSDGRLIIDFIAEHLGLPYLSPYLESVGANYRHGANFAAGGSTICRVNQTIHKNGISPFSLDIQLVQFDQFRERTSELYHQVRNLFDRRKLPRPNEFSRALYTFDIGQNDLVAGLGRLTETQLLAAIPDLVNRLAGAVIHLYHRGARSFWIHNTGPIGCLPAATFRLTNPKPGFLDKNGCIIDQNVMALEFNRQLKARIVKLRSELPRASLIYADVFSTKYHLISNANYYGFKEPLKVCCGRHGNEINVWCGHRAVVNGSAIIGVSCSSPELHISWDGVHYSQAANQWVANHILNGSYSDPPKPIAQACLKNQ